MSKKKNKSNQTIYLIERKSFKIFQILTVILLDFRCAVVWTYSVLWISSFLSLFSRFFGIVPRDPSIISSLSTS